MSTPDTPKRIALLREQKSPPERRAPLSPDQCRFLLTRESSPGLEIYVERSPDRIFPDEAYEQAGAKLVDRARDMDVYLGIKERLPDTLEPGGTYVFFSHTIKEQPANSRLLKTVLERGVRLIDYELITDNEGARLVAFGYFAGVVGAVHGLRMWQARQGAALEGPALSPASSYQDMEALDGALSSASWTDLRVVVTGSGRVSQGAVDVLERAGLKRLSGEAFLELPPVAQFAPDGVFTQLSSRDLYALRDGSPWPGSRVFYQSPERFDSLFGPYIEAADLLITGGFWRQGYPRLFEAEALLSIDRRLSLISDVSCDIDGAVPLTIRTSTIDAPYYDIDPATLTEHPPFGDVSQGHVTMMAIDNLPTEMPAPATEHFGKQLIEHFLDDLLTDGPLTARATIARDGQLTPAFGYLSGYAGLAPVKA